jgi:hypothetical protein
MLKYSNTFSHKNDSIWIASRIITASTYGRTQRKSITIAHPLGNRPHYCGHISTERQFQAAAFAKRNKMLRQAPLGIDNSTAFITWRNVNRQETSEEPERRQSETLISPIFLKFVSFSKLFLALPLELGLHSLDLFSKLNWAGGLRCQ